jgi:hypothetical protein
LAIEKRQRLKEQKMNKVKQIGLVGAVAVMSFLGGCTHLKGVVLDDATGRPVPAAYFTVGRPTGVGVSATYRVDQFGRFDFSISPTDEDFLFLWDGNGDPETDVRRVYKTEMGTDMKIRMRQAMPGPQF